MYQVPAENKLQRKIIMILGHSSNGLQKNRKEMALHCDLEVQLSTLLKPFHKSAARYLDFGLEELVPSLWVESEREYDISAAYGITHWWFRRKEFYINKHSEPLRDAVRSQMRFLSLISVIARIVIIKQRSTLNVQIGMPVRLFIQRRLTIVPKPRAVVYRDRNDQRKLMRLNELHKFSDGTLTRVMEKLDHMVKDFHLFEYNKGIEI
ncbi:hypothetical protein Tco_0164711 [Tanacetum coccineum]